MTRTIEKWLSDNIFWCDWYLQDQNVYVRRILLPHPPRGVAHPPQCHMWHCWQARALPRRRERPPELRCHHLPRQGRRAHPTRVQLQRPEENPTSQRQGDREQGPHHDHRREAEGIRSGARRDLEEIGKSSSKRKLPVNPVTVEKVSDDVLWSIEALQKPYQNVDALSINYLSSSISRVKFLQLGLAGCNLVPFHLSLPAIVGVWMLHYVYT